jgi:hypothetical protein
MESQADEGSGVALCFKVPLSFRRWFKLQALSRNLTMTEFLVKAAESYATAAAAQPDHQLGAGKYFAMAANTNPSGPAKLTDLLK